MRALTQVQVENDALLAQAKAWKESADLSLKRKKNGWRAIASNWKSARSTRRKTAWWLITWKATARVDNSSTIKAGTAVRERQQLMSIPDLSRMQVKTAVHESVVDRVKPGLETTIRLDAFPDRVYHGQVESVAVLPDPGNWLSSDTKVYETIVTIDEEVEQLKPGMTAVAEIHIDYLKNILCVPVQAIVQRRNDTWCYVADERSA